MLTFKEKWLALCIKLSTFKSLFTESNKQIEGNRKIIVSTYVLVYFHRMYKSVTIYFQRTVVCHEYFFFAIPDNKHNIWLFSSSKVYSLSLIKLFLATFCNLTLKSVKCNASPFHLSLRIWSTKPISMKQNYKMHKISFSIKLFVRENYDNKNWHIVHT